MSNLLDTLFGGVDDSAQQATLKQNREAIAFNDEMTKKAYADVLNMFGPSVDVLSQGAQSAIDYTQGATPRRATILQQGNQRSRQATLAGLDQIQNAILGMPVDMSALQFAPLQMPETTRTEVPVFNLPAQLTNASTQSQQPEAFTWDSFLRKPGNEDLMASYRNATWADSPDDWANRFWMNKAREVGDPRIEQVGQPTLPNLGGLM